MRIALLGLMALLVGVNSAQAACNTASLAGKWTTVGQDSVCTVTIQTSGAFSAICSSPPNFSGNISLTAACKVSGTANGILFKGRTEPIPTTAAVKPTIMIAASTNGLIAFAAFKQ